MEWYFLHPVAVHFPIALLTVGFLLEVIGRKVRKDWLAPAAAWLLYWGTIGAWAALALGLLAEKTVPHVPPAWEILEEHETLAWWTCGVFTWLSLWRWRFAEKAKPGFLVLWLLGLVLLGATGYHGGELVFQFGMGTKLSAG